MRLRWLFVLLVLLAGCAAPVSPPANSPAAEADTLDRSSVDLHQTRLRWSGPYPSDTVALGWTVPLSQWEDYERAGKDAISGYRYAVMAELMLPDLPPGTPVVRAIFQLDGTVAHLQHMQVTRATQAWQPTAFHLTARDADEAQRPLLFLVSAHGVHNLTAGLHVRHSVPVMVGEPPAPKVTDLVVPALYAGNLTGLMRYWESSRDVLVEGLAVEDTRPPVALPFMNSRGPGRLHVRGGAAAQGDGVALFWLDGVTSGSTSAWNLTIRADQEEKRLRGTEIPPGAPCGQGYLFATPARQSLALDYEATSGGSVTPALQLFAAHLPIPWPELGLTMAPYQAPPADPDPCQSTG